MAKKTDVPAEKVNKRKLVSEALDTLGAHAGPNDIIKHIKEKTGHEFDYSLVASYKSNLNKAKGGALVRSRNVVFTGTVDMKDVMIVRDLLGRLGESQLQQLIRALK